MACKVTCRHGMTQRVLLRLRLGASRALHDPKKRRPGFPTAPFHLRSTKFSLCTPRFAAHMQQALNDDDPATVDDFSFELARSNQLLNPPPADTAEFRGHLHRHAIAF